MTTTRKIRGHHLLCLQGFQGYGYSDEFVAGLGEIVREWRENPELWFEVAVGSDAICAPCPHRDGENCRKDLDADRRIREMDRKTLEKIGLHVKDSGRAQDLINIVNAKLKTTADVADICGPCPWQTQCLWYQSRVVSLAI